MKGDKAMKAKHNRPLNKTMLIVALCSLIALCTVGGIWAYLVSRPDPITNTFEPAFVTCEVEEQFDGNTKSDVRIRNTGNVDAFVRAAVIVNFVSDDGKILATAPQEGVDFSIVWATSEWKKGTDGFWYHSSAVSADSLTVPLIQSASVISAPDGYSLDIQIIATAIQSNPEKAVSEAWGITPENGKIRPN